MCWKTIAKVSWIVPLVLIINIYIFFLWYKASPLTQKLVTSLFYTIYYLNQCLYKDDLPFSGKANRNHCDVAWNMAYLPSIIASLTQSYLQQIYLFSSGKYRLTSLILKKKKEIRAIRWGCRLGLGKPGGAFGGCCLDFRA